MVTLVQQQQQQTSDDNHQYQKEQDRANGTVVSVESHAVDKFHGEVAESVKKTAVVAPGNGSAGDSSTQCSDVDDDDDDEEEETDVEQGGGWMTNLPVSSTIIQQHQAVATANGDVVLPNADPSNFGDVCVKNSTNVHLGNKTFYKGPVTIKQFVYTSPTSIQEASKFEDGSVSDANVSDLSTSKDDGVANRPIFPQNTELNKGNNRLCCMFNRLLRSITVVLNIAFIIILVTQWLWTWRCAVLSCALALIFLTAIVIAIVHFTRHTDTPPTLVLPEIPGSSLEGK